MFTPSTSIRSSVADRQVPGVQSKPSSRPRCTANQNGTGRNQTQQTETQDKGVSRVIVQARYQGWIAKLQEVGPALQRIRVGEGRAGFPPTKDTTKHLQRQLASSFLLLVGQ